MHPELAVLRAIKRALTEAAGRHAGVPARRRRNPPRAGHARATSATTSTCCRCSASSPAGEQDAALRPAKAGRRKIVLATNIAETSLTIDGVRIVVDAGLERRSLFDPSSGMNRLEVQRISRASAEQRAGRAGRTAPGVCLPALGRRRRAQPRGLRAAGSLRGRPRAAGARSRGLGHGGRVRCAGSIAPPAATLASARDLLRRLGALDAAGKVTAHGRAMQEFPAHPRLAHMLLKARELEAGAAGRGAGGAAVRSRPAARGRVAPRARQRRAHAARSAAPRVATSIAARSIACGARSARSSSSWARRTGRSARCRCRRRRVVGPGLSRPHRRGAAPGSEARYQLSNGRGAVFASAGVDRARGIHRRRRSRRSGARSAAFASPRRSTRRTCSNTSRRRLRRADELVWDERTEAVVARRVIRFDELLVEEKPLNDVPRAASAAAMLEGVRSLGIDALPWDDEARDFLARCEFVRRLGRKDLGDWPDSSPRRRWRGTSAGSSRSSRASRAARSSRACRCWTRCARG